MADEGGMDAATRLVPEVVAKVLDSNEEHEEAPVTSHPTRPGNGPRDEPRNGPREDLGDDQRDDPRDDPRDDQRGDQRDDPRDDLRDEQREDSPGGEFYYDELGLQLPNPQFLYGPDLNLNAEDEFGQNGDQDAANEDIELQILELEREVGDNPLHPHFLLAEEPALWHLWLPQRYWWMDWRPFRGWHH